VTVTDKQTHRYRTAYGTQTDIQTDGNAVEKSKFICSNITSHLHVTSGKTVYEQGQQASQQT